jgi:hypothetical protein
MVTKQIQEQYRADAKFVEAAPLKRYQDTLPYYEKRSKQVKVVGLCLLPGTRSYECKVVGKRVELSGKVLTVLEHFASQQNVQAS